MYFVDDCTTDIVECGTQAANCGDNMICQDSGCSFTCTCENGFEPVSAGDNTAGCSGSVTKSNH